jgi:digalactosyldiacylglycerol synthase
VRELEMAPSEGLGSGGDGVPAPAERALSFISKSLTEVQKSTGMDMKLIQSRVESALRDKSKSLDRNWKESSLANFPAKAKLDVRNVSVEDFDLLKSLKPKLDSSWSDMSMQGRKSELRVVPQMDKALGFGKSRERGATKPERERRVVVKAQGTRKKIRVSETWDEPLKKVKKTVEEGLRDLETTAASSKTPGEFFENVQKTEFFENVKRNLVSPHS